MNTSSSITSFDQAAAPVPFGESGTFEPLLSAAEASRLIGIHPATLLRLARRGEVPCYRLGRRVAFRASELQHWLSKGTYNGEAIHVAQPERKAHGY